MLTNKDKIIKDLSLRLNIPVKVVEYIIESQFIFVKEQIRKGEHKSVRLPFFGRFLTSKGRTDWIDNRKAITKQRKEDECNTKDKVGLIIGTRSKGKTESIKEKHSN